MTWRLRLKYGLLAGLVGWFVGWLVSSPFEFVEAWRYVDGHVELLPEALSKGLFVWAAFCLFMAVIGFVPVGLPLLLLTPPAWIVRRRWWLIPLAPLAATLAIDARMGFLVPYFLRHPQGVRAFFFSGPNFFVLGFGLGVISSYVMLVKRRLDRAGLGSPRL